MTKCGTCSKWYHMSCEGGDFKSNDWKCKTCYTFKTLDIEKKVEHIDVDDVASQLSDSSGEHESIALSWKHLVNSFLRKYTAALPIVDLASFTRFLTRSLKEAWFLDLIKLKEIDFPSNPLLCGMDNPSIQVICRYNSCTYENQVKL